MNQPPAHPIGLPDYATIQAAQDAPDSPSRLPLEQKSERLATLLSALRPVLEEIGLMFNMPDFAYEVVKDWGGASFHNKRLPDVENADRASATEAFVASTKRVLAALVQEIKEGDAHSLHRVSEFAANAAQMVVRLSPKEHHQQAYGGMSLAASPFTPLTSDFGAGGGYGFPSGSMAPSPPLETFGANAIRQMVEAKSKEPDEPKMALDLMDAIERADRLGMSDVSTALRKRLVALCSGEAAASSASFAAGESSVCAVTARVP